MVDAGPVVIWQARPELDDLRSRLDEIRTGVLTMQKTVALGASRPLIGPPPGEQWQSDLMDSPHHPVPSHTLARQVTPHYTWDDLVLPADRTRQLHEIADQVRHRTLIHSSWGFGRTVGAGGGLAVLFTGPSGTGKSMATAVLAHDLGLDLYEIGVPAVLGANIAETERHLAQVFDQVAARDAVLLLDDVDVLVGGTAADRYGNNHAATSYLRQLLERAPSSMSLVA